MSVDWQFISRCAAGLHHNIVTFDCHLILIALTQQPVKPLPLPLLFFLANGGFTATDTALLPCCTCFGFADPVHFPMLLVMLLLPIIVLDAVGQK